MYILCKKLPICKSGKSPCRKLIINCIVFLHNFRTHYVGLNQISTVFNPEYERFINVVGYDRIARYYANDNNDVI